MSVTTRAVDALLDHAALKEAAVNDLFALVTELVDDARHGRIDSESLDAVQFIAEQCVEAASSTPVGVAN
ncbi:MAG: hypothetical protein KJN71_09385 [Acidimicrobiia bacterium]|nr:hypothetical protein [Acidimicrobiia bacterium]